MTDTQSTRVGEQRPGGRAERVRNSVLEATAELLDEMGYESTSYEEIAKRAGVHKTTVYRRWPSKPELVAEALDLHSEQHVPVPDTGELAGDLTALAAAVAANITSPGGARRSTSIVAAAANSADLTATVHQFMLRRVALTEAIVIRAIERRELPTDTDTRLVIETLVGPIWFRFLLTGEPVDDEFVAELVALVTAGAAAPTASPS